jgi:KDO2-lipid IV(A) lauroyltransferase
LKNISFSKELFAGKMKYRPKHIAEYLLLRGIAGVSGVLSYRLALTLGWGVAALAFYGVRWRRAEAVRRIREVFGEEYTNSDVKRIAWLSLRNLVFNTIEMIAASRLNRAWLEKHAECEAGRDTLSTQVTNGEGAILAVIHMGNWEAAGIGMEQLGIPMLVISRSQKNPLFNDYLNRMRSIHESVVVDRDDRALMKKVLGWLKDGKVVAIMIDLRAKQNTSIFSFLGKEASLGRGIGVIARHSGAPIFPAITIRKGWTGHAWTLCEPIRVDHDLDGKSDSIRMTQTCLQIFDRVIREQPDQYFWYNKRWVLETLNTKR